MTCSYPSRALPFRLMESFSSLPDDVSWSHISGGMITTRCGIIAVGTAMHMKGVSVADDQTLRSGLLHGLFAKKCS